ncbi:xanthine dehydrogenase family protein molybdopterin-binding subunit [Zavarzinia sp. CC-PAN008]|uniref:xanthine dehydrogenase family protein molybdopterin-binding subunit n=1 Tax=Zavarzinia sp. CC-PAN008 TaxID=3243332 RepID=UPI003F74385C
MAKFGIGQSVTRKEDDRLIIGKGRYTDDVSHPGQLQAYFVRSPYAAARITRFDATAARAMPGVHLVWGGADVEAAGLGKLPCAAMLPHRDGSAMVPTMRPIVVTDRVRHVGDTVAVVVAETINQAKDAAEAIEIDYDMLPSVTDTEGAVAPGAPAVWDEVPGNVALDWEVGDGAGVEKAIAEAAHVSRIKLVNNRAICCPMEPRVASAVYDAGADRIDLTVCSQGVHVMRNVLSAAVLQIPPEKLHVTTNDVGGGFGTKMFPYPEYPLVAHLAKELGKPVKWMGERQDGFVTDLHGRDHVTIATLAFDKDKKITAFKVETIAAMGAYLSIYAPFIPTMAGAQVYGGVYGIPSIYLNIKCVYSNTTPTDAYRGAGRPEACYVIERALDAAAGELGISPADLRRINFIPTGAMPYAHPLGLVYDSGDFHRNLDGALKLADEAGLASRKAAARAKGRYRGLGIGYYIEKTGADPNEHADVRIQPDGKVIAYVGTQATGQGHETAFAQMLSDKLGLPYEQIEIRMGDSDHLPNGGGTGGSRSLTLGGGAVITAGQNAVDKGKEFAADALEAAVADIEYGDGAYKVAGTDRTIDVFAVAKIAAEKTNDGGLYAEAMYTQPLHTFPNGAHVCEVEVDGDTGVVEIVKYSVVDDFGKVVNPLLLAGQVHGGIVQGLGQAFLENVVYDNDSGQLLTGSFMDYCPPRASDVPSFDLAYEEGSPCTTNPFGVKGAGEAGTIGAPPALVNAVVDALSPLGITHLDMPLTPLRVWQAIQQARPAAAAE